MGWIFLVVIVKKFNIIKWKFEMFVEFLEEELKVENGIKLYILLDRERKWLYWLEKL